VTSSQFLSDGLCMNISQRSRCPTIVMLQR